MPLLLLFLLGIVGFPLCPTTVEAVVQLDVAPPTAQCPSSCGAAQEWCSQMLLPSTEYLGAPLNPAKVLAAQCEEGDPSGSEATRSISFNCVCESGPPTDEKQITTSIPVGSAAAVDGSSGSSGSSAPSSSPLGCRPKRAFDNESLAPYHCLPATGQCALTPVLSNVSKICDFFQWLQPTQDDAAAATPQTFSDEQQWMLSFAVGCHRLPVCTRNEVDGDVQWISLTCPPCGGRAGSMYEVLLNASTGSDDSCTRTLVGDVSSRDHCGRNCGGHGCCTFDQNSQPVCSCYADAWRGFWTGYNCDRCLDEYDGQRDKTCRTKKSAGVILLQDLGRRSSLPMTFPFILIMLMFISLSMLRRRWTSDQPFELLINSDRGIRPYTREVTSVVDPNEPLFKDKVIPRRPARSVGLVNTTRRMTSAAAAAAVAPGSRVPRGHARTTSAQSNQ